MFGLGVELETGIYYEFRGKIYSVDIEKLLKSSKSNLFEEEKYLLSSLPLLETPSNKCLVNIKNKQIEIVTKFPLNKPIEEIIYELEIELKRFLVIFQKLFNCKNNSKNILLFYPKLSCMKYKDINNEEVFSNTGSIHINITFPYYNKSQLNKYKRFIELFQTLEPILIALTSSGDYRYKKPGYPKSGYRSILGWGAPGTSNKNLLKYGLSKTATFNPNYIYRLDKYILTPLNYEKCESYRIKSDKRYYKKFDVNIPEINYSGDIATIKKDYFLRFIGMFDKNLSEKFSYRIYEQGFGLEIRFFDRMDPKNIKELLYFLTLLGEFSFETKHNLVNSQKNKFWNEEVLNIFDNGYNSKLSDEYIKLLEKNFDMKIKTKKCETIINEIITMLYNNYKQGKFINEMSDVKNIKKPKIFNMNKAFLDAYQ